jgi:hypothetical protein
VAHPVIAGALFDFMGWLTSRKKTLILSSADNASPAVEAITEFAKMRGLSLDGARVQDWQDIAPKQDVPETNFGNMAEPVSLVPNGPYSAPIKELWPVAPKPWVGLSEKDKTEIRYLSERDDRDCVMALVEAKLREKNGGAA